jgi:hypothetical protein
MDYVETVAYLDQVPNLHEARILILLNAFTGSDGIGSIDGLTKLAKLDFLLRYPVMLQRALVARNRSFQDVQLEDHERQNVESEMVRYRFGPWDHRYRAFLNFLVAKGLVTIIIEGRKVVISLTEPGREYANKLVSVTVFEPYARRSQLLKRHFDLTATNLMRFIYDTFPEIISLKSGERIQI